MSVEPWIEACPRRAMIPPPGRPMLPSSSWRVAAVVGPGVLPGGVVVGAPLRVPAAEQAVGVLGVLEPLVDDGRGVGVAGHVLLEVALVLDDVVDDRAEEHDVTAGPEGHVQVGQGAGAGEARV